MEIDVEGMSCEGCRDNVEDAISGVEGVDTVDVDLDGGRAEVEGSFDVDAVEEAIEEAGYKAEP